jgi:hypothetical protein
MVGLCWVRTWPVRPRLARSRGNVGLRIKDPLTPSISPKFYSRTGRWGSYNLVSEVGGIEFEPRPKGFLASSISPEFYSWSGRGGPYNLGLCSTSDSIPLSHVFSAALIPPSLAKSPNGGALQSTHMARTAAAHTQYVECWTEDKMPPHPFYITCVL